MSTDEVIAADVAIVGAGIAGLSTALELVRRGRRVVGTRALVDRRRGIRSQCRWCTPAGSRAGGNPAGAIGCQALAERLDDNLRRPTGYRQTGHIYVAENTQDLESIATQRSRERQLGLTTELIGPEEVRRLAPGIGPDLPGAKFCPTDGVADPARATMAIAAAAEEEGVTIRCHTPVTAIGQANGRVIYVQAGALCASMRRSWWMPPGPGRHMSRRWSVSICRSSRAGSARCVPVPMPLLTNVFVQTVAYDFGCAQYADFSVRLSSGANRDDVGRFTFDRKFHPDEELAISDRARRIFPALAQAELAGGWAGIRECTPDMMPILGPVGGPHGFFVCAGFSGHGFCLGPAVGKLMTEWIIDGAPSLDLSAFSWRRFMRPEGPLAVIQLAPQQTG